MKVSYEKSMRDKAIADGKGLATVEINYPGKSNKKLGCRITMQGPVTLEECQQLDKFLAGMIERRQS